MDCYLLVIGIRDHIGRIDVVEHDLIKSKQDSDGNEAGVPILVRVDPFERAVTNEPWMSME